MVKMNNATERMLNRLTLIEGDMRHMKADQTALRAFIDARAGETETMIARNFDMLNARLDQTESSVETRSRHLEGKRPT